jgi:hypothetical protein
MTIRSKIEALAEVITTRAKDKDTPFAEAVDALKALTALYGTLLKDKGKSEDDSDGFTMADAQATIEDTGHGSEASVRSSPRRRTASHSN